MGKTNLELGFRAAATALKLLSSTLVAGEDGCLFCPAAQTSLALHTWEGSSNYHHGLPEDWNLLYHPR